MSRGIPWTEERLELLRKMRGEGVSFSLCAEALGYSRNAVIGKAQRHGILGPTRATQAKELLREELPLLVCNPVGFWQLESHHCRWILNETVETPRLENTLYCGAKAALGTSWCPRHYRMVYRIEASAGRANVAA